MGHCHIIEVNGIPLPYNTNFSNRYNLSGGPLFEGHNYQSQNTF